jgi:hypothetical protein
VTDGKKFIAQIMFFSHKKYKNVKISNKKFSFVPSLIQYFPHIPYVASKKSKFQQILGSGWRLHGIFSSFQIFLAGQQSKLTEKLNKQEIPCTTEARSTFLGAGLKFKILGFFHHQHDISDR